MKLRINGKSKTLWLQIGVASAAVMSPQFRELVCQDPQTWTLTHCGLTALAYLVQFRDRTASLSVIKGGE